jgi:micrococcal nuclease
MKKFFLLTILILIVLVLYVCFHSTTSNVVSITDGDTITILLKDKTQQKVRLEEIDCPEKSQSFGKQAKEILSKKIFGKNIDISWTKKDQYGRVIGKVYLNGRYINKEMVQEGWAWHYTKYSKSSEMASAQLHAQKYKLGLWKDKNPIPPWDFRKKK